MQYFYKPAPGVIGDTIPYYFEGRYHVFYLRDYRDVDSYGIGSTWGHISTTDFVRFEDHQEALAKGSIDEQDATVATGCVYTDAEGQHHIFYTGINPYFRTETAREQGIMHAVSSDLIEWKKVPGDLWLADTSRYERHDWRDPFVFRDPVTGRYRMIVAARKNSGPSARRGCTGLLNSDDLVNWEVEDPLYAPGRYHGHECPDMFQMGEWYYLVFSEYTTQTSTRYVMSRSPSGPWVAPPENRFDNRAFYAAKTASDGTRRFIFGWNPTKKDREDSGEWQWGGSLTVHEVLQRDDGSLVVRMPPEALRAFERPRRVALDTDGSAWERSDEGYAADSQYGHSEALSGPLPTSFMLEAELVFDRGAGEAGLLLGVSAGGDQGYFLRFSAAARVVQFGKIGGYRPWYVDHMPELDRPLELEPGKALSVRVIVDGTAVVAYADDRVALSARMYGGPGGRCGLFADGAVVSVRALMSRELAVR